MPNNHKLRILHISDLHIRPKDEFDQSVVLDPLIQRVAKDRESGLTPEIVAVTGDIAFSGKQEEYEAANVFFDNLLASFDLPPDRLFIVPGNHDVNRKKYRPSDVPAYENMKALNTELEDEDFRSDLLKGMKDYFSFIETHYPHMKNIQHGVAPFADVFQVKCGKKIGLVGLNSAWMCRKSSDEKQIAIGEYQVKTAMAELRAKGEIDLQINMFHHPLDWLWPKDKSICKGYFNNTILLCGHLHDAAGGYYSDLDGKLYQFQAGGAYPGSDSDWPARFQYITVDWRKGQIRLDFRKFLTDKRKWSLDADTGDDGVIHFELIKPTKRTASAPTEPPMELPETYVEWLTENYGHMDADRLQGKGQAIVISLPEIFIPLYARESDKKSGKRHEPKEKQTPVDVEELIGRSYSLLIEGHAGSGKTTLLKHLAYCLAIQNQERRRIIGLSGFLPVLVMLKDLVGIFYDTTVTHKKGLAAEDYLEWYFRRKMGNVLNLDTINRFIDAGRAIVLLDGLDETPTEYRDAVVNAFSDFRIRRKGARLVLTGRPHGIAGAALNRFGKNHVSILTLNPDQVRLFILKWFAHLYPGSSGIGGKNADAMIGELREHPAIDRLIDNPLMLTAICILYHDGKELPGQRAELYKKFIDNLLYRRFPDPEIVHDFLKTLAFKMHEKEFRSADRGFATDILKEVYPIHVDESEKEHKNRIDTLFDHIEPRCGLLKFENGQYSFWHLTFQEFLTADYIADNHSDHVNAIQPYWVNDWYKEVIELYVGNLSIEHKKTANDIVASALDAGDGQEYKRWRLAARSLIDIHKNRRQEDVIEKARRRMLEIFDTDVVPKVRVDAGESLGWLGDPRDLKEFVKIEGGDYELEEIGRVTLQPFEICKYPVTNSWYGEFIDSNGYDNRNYWSPKGREWLGGEYERQPLYWNDRKWKCPNSPVVGVCWYEAEAFTRWLTTTSGDGLLYRLPSNEEWQAAAAGFEGREYPWGNIWDKNKCNSKESNIGKTSPVGIFKKGSTPEGFFDLSGNVLEWTESWNERDKTEKVIRGGCWLFDSTDCRCASQDNVLPSGWDDYCGFRCIRT